MEKHVPWQNHSVIAKFRIRFKRIKEKKNQKLPPLAKFAEAATRGVLWKKVFFEISQNSQENTCARVSCWIRLQALGLQLIKEEALAQVFSCEFCDISKNTLFTEHLWATASSFIFSIKFKAEKFFCTFVSCANQTSFWGAKKNKLKVYISQKDNKLACFVN